MLSFEIDGYGLWRLVRFKALIIAFTLGLFGCASPRLETSILLAKDNVVAKKDIFVFLDGTGNNSGTETNVWKTYRLIADASNPNTTALYVAGVASAEDAPLPESALGRGMQARILEGYQFLSHNYSVGDRIFIFGFSRGALQARALAGLVAYAGLLEYSDAPEKDMADDANHVIELVKKRRDEEYRALWESWTPGQAPVLATEIERELKLKVIPAEIEFLGIWDTVPGSSLKNYGVCKEEIGKVKEFGHIFIPGVDSGERYKSDSYPPIGHIVHAVSLDEKRSKFQPLLVCSAMNDTLTQIDEMWFPGAHSDVGGGYTDSDDLPRISLRWMLELLAKHYPIDPVVVSKGNALGLAHWSVGDSPANIGSKCEDRKPSRTAKKHSSVQEREEASPAPLRRHGRQVERPYPITCGQEGQFSQFERHEERGNFMATDASRGEVPLWL